MTPIIVMAGLGPASRVFTGRVKDADGRHEGGHDALQQRGLL